VTSTLDGTAVLIGPTGVLIRGPSGSGKSRLALALIAKGARLVADDRVMVSQCHGRLVAGPPGPTAGLLEVRGRGIILAVPCERWAVLRLAIDLVERPALERLPEAAELCDELCGVRLARQPIAIGDSAAALLVEMAALAAHNRPGAFPLRSP
jgi:HPr kinase/phosphorylase